MKFLVSTLIATVVFCLSFTSLFAASIHVEPAATTINLGATVEMEIKADTMQDPVSAVEAFIVFDPAFFDISDKTITYGTIFTKKETKLDSDTLLVTAVQEDSTIVLPFTGTVATIPFTAKKVGKTSILLYCDETQERSTKIFKRDANFSNILDCSTPGNNHRVDVTINQPDVLGVQTQQIPKQNTNNTYSFQLIALVSALLTGVLLFGISLKRQKS